MSSKVLLAVDGNSLLHRSFHAQASSALRTADGRAMWAVRGVVSQLVSAVERVEPDAVVIGFDDPDTSLRREHWPQYKAKRVEKPATLAQQLLLAIDVISAMGIQVIVPAGLEADDVLASAARHATDVGAHTVVMTSDRDSFALINESTTVLRILNGGVEASPMLTPSRLELLLGIRPDQYRDFAALRGDASDNLVGVHGIGAKTAAKLLCALGSARAAFEDLDAAGEHVTAAVGKAAASRLRGPDARAAWKLNCAVMAMHDTIPITIDFEGGVGCLPLASEAVRSAFDVLQLTWTLPKALRVLAGARETGSEIGAEARQLVSAGPDGEQTAHTSYGDRSDYRASTKYSGSRSYAGTPGDGWSSGRKPLSPLRRRGREAQVDQLSLF